MPPHFAPRLHQRRQVLARFERAHEEEIRRRGRSRNRTKPRRRRFRHRHDPLRAQPEPLDGLLPHRLARRHDHGGDPQFQQYRGAVPHPLGCAAPHPRGEIVKRKHAGPARNIRHCEIRAVDQVRAQPAHFARHAPQPPAPLHGIARAAAALEVGRAARRHPERLIGAQKVFVIRKAPRQRQAELSGITGQSAARKAQRCRFNRHAHVLSQE